MKKLFIVLAGLLLLTYSCQDDTTDTVICSECEGIFSEILYMWVNNEPIANPDNPEEKCIEIQYVDAYNSNYADSLWEPFCDTICGFDFEEGMRYKLKVQRKKIDKDKYKYCLLEYIETRIAPLK